MSLLPVPKVPTGVRGMTAEQVAAVAGEVLARPLRTIEAAVTDAEEAVAALVAARPGDDDGIQWKEALAADVQAYATGKTPTAAAALIADDPTRWGIASAACRYVPAAVKAAKIDHARIAAAAERMAAGRAAEWVEAARLGWETRTDPATAWTHRRSGEQALAARSAALAVARWATGSTGPAPRAADEFPPAVHLLPPHKVARGWWLALELVLSPTRWLKIPDGVQWPEGVELLLDRAVDEPVGFTALRQNGWSDAAPTRR